MNDRAFICNFEKPARVHVGIQVLNFVAVSNIINVPTTAIAGTPLHLSGNVLPDNATYQRISWSVCDAGTTNATITGNTLNTTASGTVIVTATIKDGTYFDKDYTQDFTIKIEPLGINEPTSTFSSIIIFPNPTTDELRIIGGSFQIKKIEVFDMVGKLLVSQNLLNSSFHQKIDISNLNSGIYLVKIVTEQGEIVRKAVKQ